MSEEREKAHDDVTDENHVYDQTSQVGRPPKDDMLESTMFTEIVENMPSYMARGVIYVLIFVFVVGIAYAYFGKMDVVVQARGKLIPKGDAAVVQCAKTGLLNKIFVKEGDTVKKGDVLAELDLTKTNLDAAKRRQQHEQKTKQKNCLGYAIQAMDNVLAGIDVKIDRQEILRLCEDTYVDAILGLKNARMAYEKAMLQANELYPRSIKTMISAVKNKELSLENKKKQLQAAEKDLVRAKEQFDLYLEMFNQGLASRVKILEEQKKYDDAVGKVDETRVALSAAEGELEEARIKLKTTRIQYDNATDDAEVTYEMAVLKYRAMLKNMNLKLEALNMEMASFELDSRFEEYANAFDQIRAPVSGTVSLVKLRTPGELIKAGDTVFTINPSDQPIVARVMIPNKSIGRVKAGLKAKLKLDAFPYQSYGIVTGSVIDISPDSKELKTGYFYETEIALDRDYVQKKGENYPLFTGLTLLSEVVVEKRRIIDNFLDPLRKLKE